jgi:hypothetical protein
MTTSAHPALGLTNMEKAEKRRRIAELKFEIAQRQHERVGLEEELKADKEKFGR